MTTPSTERAARYRTSHYQTIARIGRGGMAEVLLASAETTGIKKLVVLKCLWPELAEDPDFVEMFLDEATLCARLAHPNVVQTHEVLHHEGCLAIAMEYIDGQPLTNVLRRLHNSPELDLGMRVRVLTSVLSGLHHAHELTDYDGTPLGVIHRDVSPHNVMVTYGGHVKLLDFGVAHSVARLHQTRPGGFKGKMGYLSPEAFRGGVVDRRADVYAVGVMLWEMLAARRLWDRASEGSIVARLAAGAAPPPLPAECDVPEGLRRICRRAMASEPGARHQSAAELEAELEPFASASASASARALGRVVGRAFEAERAKRQAIVDAHLHGIATVAGRSGAAPATDYEVLEISEGTSPVAAAPRRRASRGGLALAFVMGVAVISGATFAHRAPAWTRMSGWTAVSGAGPSPAAARPPSATDVAPAAPPAVEPAPPTRAKERPRREGVKRRPPPLDLTSDDVLDLDGFPLAASRADGASGHAGD
jgi:hypothetical protein